MKTSFLSWTFGLVAVTALVACGDDTNADGTGGAGGEGTTATTTTTTTTTSTGEGPTTSTSTTSTSTGDGGAGGQGGAGGSGGEGAGIPDDCTEVTILDLASAGGQQPNILFGALDPSLGGADDDLGIIEFWNQDVAGNPVTGFEPGTYDLSEETQYAECGRCVVAYEDAGEESIARYYFQESGTLELAAEGAFIQGGFGTVTLTNVVLREVTIAEGAVSTYVDGGACLIIPELVYDNPSPAPDGWTCNPSWYGDEAGCDCDCGAYDIDCDDAAQEVLNCQDGQTCDDAGVCEGVPTAWECDPAAFADGATCDCACGAIDPDCDVAANPVEGCPNDDDQCIQDTCVPATEEGLCTNLTDDDVDNSIDCGDADDCQGTAECTPGAGARNSLCDAHSDCDTVTGNDPLCFPGNANFCSEWCTIGGNDCGAGNICVDVGGFDQGACLTTCTDDDDCPAEFDCADLDGAGTLGCLPGVPSAWICDETYFGDGFCDCGCGVVDPDCGTGDEEVCAYCELPSCANDGTDFGCDLAALVDDNNAICVN